MPPSPVQKTMRLATLFANFQIPRQPLVYVFGNEQYHIISISVKSQRIYFVCGNAVGVDTWAAGQVVQRKQGLEIIEIQP